MQLQEGRMRYYTKEWERLLEKMGTAEMYEPVLDKEYSDEEIAALYEDMMEKYVQESRSEHDEPPFFMEELADLDPDDFDPEDYLIGRFDEDGNEVEVRNPESLEELLQFQEKEREALLEEYENRPPFDEEEAREEYEEDYKDNLEDPDEDLPEWVRATVDKRLIAMYLLPEGVYKKLKDEDEKVEKEFNALDEIADKALEEAMESIPDDLRSSVDELDERDGDYVTEIRTDGEDLVIGFACWDDKEDQIMIEASFEDAEIIEDEKVSIETDTDEDGEIESNCDLTAHEVYFEDGKLEVHLMFDNDDELKYLTFRCSGISFCTAHQN
jgi:hypothetical protein